MVLECLKIKLMKYPRFIFDTSKVKELRKKIQKDIKTDEITAFYIVRPWSIYISIFLYKFTNLTANNVTFLMMILSFIFPLNVYLITSLNDVLLYTPIYFYILYSLDMIDGELARLRNTPSKLGEFYDSALWFSLPIFFVIYIYKLSIFIDLPSYIFIFSLITISAEIFLLVAQSLFSKNKGILNFLAQDSRFIFKAIVFFKFILSKQNIYLLFPILFFLFHDINQEFSSYFFTILLIIYNIYNIIKFIKIKNSLT